MHLKRALIGRYEGANVYIEPLTYKYNPYTMTGYKNSAGDSISNKRVVSYGEIDFTNKDDIEGLRAARITDTAMWVNSEIDVELGTLGNKFHDTLDNLRLVMRGYIKIGKPKESIIYRDYVSARRD